MKQYDVIIIGGGAAGFFAAINIAEQNSKLKVAILERGKEGLQKVKISGGGRCNITHAEFIPSELVLNYPRGEKELLGPFHTFMTGDTIEWFEKRGVNLKIEEDGRMFPVSNSSQTIIDCFLNEAKKYQIELLYSHSVKNINQKNSWLIETNQGDFSSEKLVVATGSNSKIWKLLEDLGHRIINPVSSLFTFNIKDNRIKNIPGVVVNNVAIKVVDSTLESQGPLLITHWGMSAPAILKLSAFGALEFEKCNYKFEIEINFIQIAFEECLKILTQIKQSSIKKKIINSTQFDLPKRLWQQLVLASNINDEARWQDLNKTQLEQLTNQLTKAVFNVDGKSTFKEEFVTAGGIDLKEINFKTYESKLHKNLYFAGEVLNIDAITGGFNFQMRGQALLLLQKVLPMYKSNELILRQETYEDYSDVLKVIERAFQEEQLSNHTEHFLVERLRVSTAFIPELSIIAEYRNEIVGHILLTRIQIKNKNQVFESLALAPVSVKPEFQNKGIGGLLINKAHKKAKKLGFKSIILLGHEDYYPKFGYELTSKYNIKLPFEAPDENCMIIQLVKKGLKNVNGMVNYPKEFFE